MNGTGQSTADDGEAQSDSAKDAGKKDSAVDCDAGVIQPAANGEVHSDSSKDTNRKDSVKVHPDSHSEVTDDKSSDRNIGGRPHIIQEEDHECDSSPGGTKLSPNTSKPDSLVACCGHGNSNNAILGGKDQSNSVKDIGGTVGDTSCETGVTDEPPPRRAGSIRSRRGSM